MTLRCLGPSAAYSTALIPSQAKCRSPDSEPSTTPPASIRRELSGATATKARSVSVSADASPTGAASVGAWCSGTALDGA